MNIEWTADGLHGPHDPKTPADALLRSMADLLGYQFFVSEDGREVKLVRPDGSVAMAARKAKERE